MDDTTGVSNPASTQLILEQQIRLRHLRVLLAVADSGGISRAAERLRVTQTAVSKVVAEIEQILGAPILERKGRGVALTKAGDFAVASARRIAAEVHVLSEDLDLLREGSIGIVTIGMQAISTKIMLAEAIAHLKKQHPRATVQIIEGIMSDLLQELRGGRLDLVIGRMIPTALSPDLTGYPLEFSPGVIVASPNHPALDNPALTMADIVKEAWWLPLSGTPIRDHFDAMLKTLGLDAPTNLVESNSANTLVVVLNNMPAFSIVPVSLANYWQERGLIQITKFTMPASPHPIGLIWSKELALGATTRMMRQSIFTIHEQRTGRRAALPPIDANAGFGVGADPLQIED